MFSNLDNFLNGIDNICKQQLNDLPDTLQTNENDSFDLDLSTSSVTKPKSKTNDDDGTGQGASFVPSKGQKTAAKRLKKIGDTLQNNLVEAKRLQGQMERNIAKASKRKSPKKPTGARPRGRRGRAVNLNPSDMSSSDSDAPLCSSNRAVQGRSQPAYDPNTIVLDCDDEFIGGPAVTFTRNVAAASAVSVEESKDLKVTVRINGKIEHYYMNVFQKLSVLTAQLSEKHTVPSDHIALMFKDKTVSEQETPNSIGYIQGLVLRAHVSDMVNKNKNMASSMANTNANKLEIKIQAEGRKRPFITYIGAKDQLITLAFACAEEFKCDVDKVALEFDGDFINFKETAEDLALDGGEMMDFFMKK
ncbi:uncharacterized protein LOC129579102 [Sitodiplosis mosellana]|uniref:uncharacterized protein LOC129579102 n=1 Tax=Sitodiplosis mosellana TaxID=263140 RepID=UPI0024444EE4|nr:uncharacterized protein LOC129579102 [Sitodiplosis mosellana]